jgi:hypothetical protein
MTKIITLKKCMTLISVLAVLMIAFSGCVDKNTPADNGTNSANPEAKVEAKAISNDDNTSGVSTLETVPAGFEYVITLPLISEEINRSYNTENVSGILEGSEGVYKGSNETDYYIDVIKLENKEAADNLITAYKSSFPPLQNVSRFTDESFNGHSAVKITDYTTFGGKTVPRYTYVWSNENYVIVVFGNTDEESPVKQLAMATGY